MQSASEGPAEAEGPRALVVGRFQPFHKGHQALIDAALDAAARVVVAIGSSQEEGTSLNPFSFEERARMVEAVYGDAVDVVAVPDIHDPPNWVAHVRDRVGAFDVFYGNDRSTSHLFEAAGVRTVDPGLVDRDRYEATTLRARMASGDPSWENDVPAPVASLLHTLDAPARLKALEA